jgi:hypothetical protein
MIGTAQTSQHQNGQIAQKRTHPQLSGNLNTADIGQTNV